MTPQASVAEIREADIPQVAEFLDRQVRAGEAVGDNPLPPVERLRWLLLENPARAADIPFGWHLRDASQAVVGAAICIPFRISAAGSEMTALMFAKFFVDPPFRGMGLGLLMRFVREGKRFPLFVASTNKVAGELFSRVGASTIDGMDHTMLGVRCFEPLVEEFLFRRLKRPGLARALAFPTKILPGRMRGISRQEKIGELIALRSAREVVDLNLPQPKDVAAIVRDRAYLDWRYFSGEAGKDVYCLRVPDEGDRMVVVNRMRSGYRAQIRVLNVLDIWPPATPAVARSLVAQLAQRYDGQFDAIWLRSQFADVESTLHADGWRRHDFPAPLGWFIDQGKRLGSTRWYLMPGESE